MEPHWEPMCGGQPRRLDDVHFELDFVVSVPLVSVVRRFVREFCDQVLGDPDATARVAMATHELLENAGRYSRDAAAHLSIEVSPGWLEIRISSEAQEIHLPRLDAVMGAMAAASDAKAHYQSLMRETAGHTRGSGLGLARIRAEGEMDVSHEVSGSSVCIVARTTFAPMAAPG